MPSSGSALALLLALVLIVPSADAELAPGATLGPENAAAAAELLSPEALAHYQAGEYRNAIAAWPAGPPWEREFAAASEKNATRLEVDERGTVVEREGGAPARGLYGLPFRIDPSDPRAGVKVIWNAYYALWRVASTHDVLALNWIGTKALERSAVLESHTLYHEGVPPSRVRKDAGLDLAAQQVAIVTAPADLHGTASLSWRFRGADQRDQAWTYIPALRRVRQVSPANRSDGFLGSDLSQDDGNFFDGKPQDFTWKLVGAREALVLADPASFTGAVARTARPDGGIEETWPTDQKVVGYQDPEWRGVAWAPRAPVLVRRKLWIVEAAPRDPYYLFPRIELGLDQETFAGATSRKFDAQGGLLRSLQFLAYASQPIEAGGEKLVLPASSMSYLVSENPKASRATVIANTVPGRGVHERRIPLDAALFSLERLSAGK
jgi:hypothetical protein